ncbi:MAG TPA: GntR family transcriptional regulator [Streptosporangiaceae bacterium]
MNSSLAGRPIHAPRLADVVADRIRELIVTGELADGERLPRIEDMLADFGVSGPSMREALRMLESDGLISVQRGSVGGAVVHRPTERTAADALALVLRSRGTSFGDVAEAMAFLDPACATLCARRPDRGVIAGDLRKINVAAAELLDRDEATFGEAMTSFHDVIVRNCGNETLRLLAGAVKSIWAVGPSASASASADVAEAREEKLAALGAHERVADLIEAGDDLQAARVMAGHIDMKLALSATDPVQLIDTRAGRQR